MSNRSRLLVAATRQAALITCAIVAVATVAVAQTTYKLRIYAASSPDFAYRGTAQITSAPSGIDCRSENVDGLGPTGACVASFAVGTVVTLTATPLLDGRYDGWTGACTNRGVTCQVEMTTDREVFTQTIAKTYTLTVTGGGDSFGQVHSNDTFPIPYIACNVQGDHTVGACIGEVPAGQTIWLGREEPTNTFARFAGWSGCGPLSDEWNCRLLMDGPKTVTASWVAPKIIIGTNFGSGTGKVTGAGAPTGSSPFDCTITPTGATGVCSARWEYGPTSIALTATATGSSMFLGWAGSCSGTGACVLTPFGQFRQPEVRALFEVVSYLLAITPAGSGSGRVTFSPARPDCVIAVGTPNNDCTHLYPRGMAVTLTADPTGGSTFGEWSGACSGTQLTCQFVLGADSHVSARFVPPRAAAELAAALLGRLTISGEEQHELDRFGNKDGVFNLGDLLALLARTGERLPASTMRP